MVKRKKLKREPLTQSQLNMRTFWVCLGLALIALILSGVFWAIGDGMGSLCSIACGLVASAYGLAFLLDEKARRRSGEIPPHPRW